MTYHLCMNNKIKILMVMASPFRSGVALENYIRAKAVYDNPDYDVDIICFPIGESIHQNNVHILRVPKNRLFKSFQIGEYKKILVYTIWMIAKLIFKKDKKYDVIFLFNASYLFFWLIKPLFRGKVVAMIYAPLAGEMTKWSISRNKIFFNLLKGYEKYILNKYDRLIFNIARMKQFYEAEGYDPQKSMLILHACEAKEVSNNKNTKDENFNILYAGSFVKVQNIDLIYQVASLLKHQKNIRFILVGGTEEEFANESRKLKKLSLNNVEIYKRVDQQLLDDFYFNADLLISCRVEGEDLPFKVIEYMSWGKCILATDRPIHNLVLNKDISCLVEPEPEIMASQILDLMQNPAKVRQYEKNVREYFLANHSFQMMKEKYDTLIHELSGTIT
jgi:glycosyltransferase involved in cell wall biosynthesis